MKTFARLYDEAHMREAPALMIRGTLMHYFGQDDPVAFGRIAKGMLAAGVCFDEEIDDIIKKYRLRVVPPGYNPMVFYVIVL